MTSFILGVLVILGLLSIAGINVFAFLGPLLGFAITVIVILAVFYLFFSLEQ